MKPKTDQDVDHFFWKQFVTVVQTIISGTEGVSRAIMMLDTKELDRETAEILEARRKNREGFVGQANHCGSNETGS